MKSNYPMGSISRMNVRSRMFEENAEIMSKIEAQYESIGATDVYWDDESEPYLELVGQLPLNTVNTFSTITLRVVFCKFYCDGDFVEEDDFRNDLENEHKHMAQFLENIKEKQE